MLADNFRKVIFYSRELVKHRIQSHENPTIAVLSRFFLNLARIFHESLTATADMTFLLSELQARRAGCQTASNPDSSMRFTL